MCFGLFYYICFYLFLIFAYHQCHFVLQRQIPITADISRLHHYKYLLEELAVLKLLIISGNQKLYNFIYLQL
jgi:hypothetical protein